MATHYFGTGDTVISRTDVRFPDETNKGITLGDDAAGAFGWHDMTAEITVRGGGANNPPWTQIGSSALYAFNFELNDECWMCYHVPHDYVPGTDVNLHVHWLPDGTNANSVKWQWDYVYARGYDQQAFNIASPTTITVETSSPEAQYQHMISESTNQTISNMEVDGLIYTRIKRITNGGTDNTDNIFVLTADLHYQSTGIPTVNRNYPFYGT